MGNLAADPYRALGAPTSRCLLCASEGEPGSECPVCFMARPTLAPEPSQVLGCVRCKNPLHASEVGAGAVVHACPQCRALFVPPRAWTRAFAARDAIGDLEGRIGRSEQSAANPLASCPICSRQMDRTRFAATSDVVIDACSAGHGVWLASGDLGRAVDYAAHKARIGDDAAVREAAAAWAKANNVDPRSHAIATEETRIRAESSARLSKYAKAGTAGIAVLVIVRLVVAIAARQHHAKPPAGAPDPNRGVQQAADEGKEELAR